MEAPRDVSPTYIYEDQTALVLEEHINEAIRLLASIEALPAEAKIYRDPTGAIQASSAAIIGRIAKWKSENPGLMGRTKNAVLAVIAWGAQALDRTFRQVDYHQAAEALTDMERGIERSLERINALVTSGESHLKKSDLELLKSKIEELSRHVFSSSLQEGLAKILHAYGPPASDGQQTVSKKVEEIMAVINPFQLQLQTKVQESLNALENKILSFSAAQPSIEDLADPPEMTEPSTLGSTDSLMSLIPSPMERSPSASPSIPVTLTELPGVILKEDASQAVKLPPRQSAPPRSRALEPYDLNGVDLRALLDRLSPEGRVALMDFTVNHWMHKKSPDNRLFADDDPRVRRLADLRIQGLTLSQVLSDMNLNQLYKLKEYIIKYWIYHWSQ